MKPEPSHRVASHACSVCGCVYDARRGDPAAGVPPGVPFERLPADWRCPRCGAPRSRFQARDSVEAGPPTDTTFDPLTPGVCQ